jgi:hypothetical protein
MLGVSMAVPQHFIPYPIELYRDCPVFLRAPSSERRMTFNDVKHRNRARVKQRQDERRLYPARQFVIPESASSGTDNK